MDRSQAQKEGPLKPQCLSSFSGLPIEMISKILSLALPDAIDILNPASNSEFSSLILPYPHLEDILYENCVRDCTFVFDFAGSYNQSMDIPCTQTFDAYTKFLEKLQLRSLRTMEKVLIKLPFDTSFVIMEGVIPSHRSGIDHDDLINRWHRFLSLLPRSKNFELNIEVGLVSQYLPTSRPRLSLGWMDMLIDANTNEGTHEFTMTNGNDVMAIPNFGAEFRRRVTAHRTLGAPRVPNNPTIARSGRRGRRYDRRFGEVRLGASRNGCFWHGRALPN